MKSTLTIALFAPIFLAGCITYHAPAPTRSAADNASQSTHQQRAIEAPAGSLWSRNSQNLFVDQRARRVGDIVTVLIREKSSASKEAATSAGRDSSTEASISKFLGLESKIPQISKLIDPTSLIDASYKNDFTGSGKTSRKEDLVATLTSKVARVLDNGNLLIEGKKVVTVNKEDQIIVLTGEIRPRDISKSNTIDSNLIHDARISYTGNGVISDKQKQGWMIRILDNAWPF